MITVPALFITSVLHWLAGLIVLAEAANKIERTDPLERGLTHRQRLVVWLKVLAWICLAIGAGGALATPFLRWQQPSAQDLAVIGGFAILIIRSRLKEVCP